MLFLRRSILYELINSYQCDHLDLSPVISKLNLVLTSGSSYLSVGMYLSVRIESDISDIMQPSGGGS